MEGEEENDHKAKTKEKVGGGVGGLVGYEKKGEEGAGKKLLRTSVYKYNTPVGSNKQLQWSPSFSL